MNEPDSTPWYFKQKSVFIALAVVGPFALPLVWMSPRFSTGWKIGLTVITVVLTWLTAIFTQNALQKLQGDLAQLKQMGVY